jgi:ABC-type amino acid transport system permease subunit
MRKTLPYLRLVTSFALLFSIVWQVTDRLNHNNFRPTEYFAYFTIHTSLIAALVLAVTGVRELQGKADTKALTLARLSVSTYAIVVAVVYNALLRGTPVLLGDPDYGYDWPVLPNEILHVWAPIFIVLDFALTTTVTKLKFKQIFWTLLFPLAWLVFTIIRGLNTDWWAYWFLNPNEKGGVASVVTFILGIVVFMLASASISLGLNRLSTKSR